MPTMRRDATAIRPVSRALAWVLGPLLILSGVAMPLLMLMMFLERGWEEIRELFPLGILMILCVPFGMVMIAAARSGVDPMAGVFRTMIPAALGQGDPAALTPGFRLFAWIAGPCMVVLGCVGPAAVVLSLRGEGWMEWAAGLYYVASMLVLVPLGVLFIRAARRGRDPTSLL
jgi:hypothetical protein